METSADTSDINIQPVKVFQTHTVPTSTDSTWNGSRHGIEAVLPLQVHKPLESFARLLRFLTTTSIAILHPDDLEKDRENALRPPGESSENGGLKGHTMEVFSGSWNGKPAALKYFRNSVPGDGVTPERRKQLHTEYQQKMYDLLFELKIMSHETLSQHRNILTAYGVSFDRAIGELEDPTFEDLINPIVVVELAEPQHPDLAKLFSAIPDSTISFDLLGGLISDVADGIAVLHEYGIVHADIKPENILITAGMTAKIGDFGSAGLDATEDKPRGFTPYWAAPECLEGCPFPGLKRLNHQKSSDVYSFGLVVGFIMLQGRRPFDREGVSIDPAQTKFDDNVDELVHTAIENFYSCKDSALLSTPIDEKQLICVHHILQNSLRLYPGFRFSSLGDIRKHVFGHDEFEQEKLVQAYGKQVFATRQGSPYGDVAKPWFVDTWEISTEISVYPFLPEFLYPIVRRLEPDSLEASYFPRHLLPGNHLDELEREEERGIDEWHQQEDRINEALSTLAKQKEILEAGKKRSNSEALSPTSAAQFFDQCERVRSVTGFGGTLQEFARLFSKLKYKNRAQYPRLLSGLLDDPKEIFNIKDPRCGNATLLHEVCRWRDLETARFLLDHGADVNAVDDEGKTPLIQTFLDPFSFLRIPGGFSSTDPRDIPAEMRIEVAKLLLSYGAKVELEVAGSPLMNLVLKQHGDKPKLVEFLITLGHCIDFSHRESPLRVAILEGCLKVAERLLKLGADPNPRFFFGTADQLEALKESGFDIEEFYLVYDKFRGRTLLEQLLIQEPTTEEDLARMELLLKYGARLDPSFRFMAWDYSPPVHMLVLRKLDKALELLLKYQPLLVLVRSPGGHTPLSIAAYDGSIEIVKILLRYGADPNARAKDGTNPYIATFSRLTRSTRDTPIDAEHHPAVVRIAGLLEGHGLSQTKLLWSFARPIEIKKAYMNSKTVYTITPVFIVADECVFGSNDRWIIRRNLDPKLGANGSCVFLKPTTNPSLSKEGHTPIEILLPVLGSLSGIFKIVLKVGVLECRHSNSACYISFFSTSTRDGIDAVFNRQDVATDEAIPRQSFGGIDLSSAKVNHSYQITLPGYLRVTGVCDIGLAICIRPSSNDVAASTGGLSFDWIEFRPIDAAECDVEENDPSLELIEDISEHVPTGVKKAMFQSPEAMHIPADGAYMNLMLGIEKRQGSISKELALEEKYQSLALEKSSRRNESDHRLLEAYRTSVQGGKPQEASPPQPPINLDNEPGPVARHKDVERDISPSLSTEQLNNYKDSHELLLKEFHLRSEEVPGFISRAREESLRTGKPVAYQSGKGFRPVDVVDGKLHADGLRIGTVAGIVVDHRSTTTSEMNDEQTNSPDSVIT